MKFINILPSISTTNAGSTGVFDLDVNGARYHFIELRLTNNGTSGTLKTVADVINELRIKLNNQTVRHYKGTQIEDIININGTGFATYVKDNDTYLMIYFNEPWRRTPLQSEALSIGTGDLSLMQIEVDIKATATAPFFEGKAYVDYLRDGNSGDFIPSGRMIHVHQIPVPASAGTVVYNDLPNIGGMDYTRLHFFSDKILDVSLRVGGQLVIDKLTKEENNAIQTRLGLNPQSDVFSLMFDQDQILENRLRMSGGKETKLRLDFTMAAGAAQFDTVFERFGPIGIGS